MYLIYLFSLLSNHKYTSFTNKICNLLHNQLTNIGENITNKSTVNHALGLKSEPNVAAKLVKNNAR